MTDEPHDWRLAIDGGPKAFPEGPPCWPRPDDDVARALADAYADGSWGQYEGRHATELTRQLAALHGVSHVHLCSSGTIAVELALRGLRVGTGDEVVLAGYDFGGNFRCIEMIGAIPVLVDIDPATWCLDVEQVEKSIGGKTRAIVASHLHGGLAGIRVLRELADRYGIALVEDACQVPGAVIDGRVAGTWGDAGVLSFGGSKLLTAGRGGAVVTQDEEIAQRIKIHCQQGNNAVPLSELQAAVLIPQLEKLDERNLHRAASVSRLLCALEGLEPLRPVTLEQHRQRHVFYKLAWLWDPRTTTDAPRAEFLTAAQAEGIPIYEGFRGFTRRSAKRCRKIGDLRHSQRASEATVLLHHPVLLESSGTIDRLAGAIAKVTGRFVDHGPT